MDEEESEVALMHDVSHLQEAFTARNPPIVSLPNDQITKTISKYIHFVLPTLLGFQNTNIPGITQQRFIAFCVTMVIPEVELKPNAEWFLLDRGPFCGATGTLSFRLG